MTKLVDALCTRILLRSLLSCESPEQHTSQVQATMGTPVLVPVPRKVMVMGGQTILLLRLQSNHCATLCQNPCTLYKIIGEFPRIV